jgi:hypothetical protein
MDGLQFFYTCFALLAYKLLYWTDRPISLSTVVLVGVCAFCTSTALFGNEQLLQSLKADERLRVAGEHALRVGQHALQALARLIGLRDS